MIRAVTFDAVGTLIRTDWSVGTVYAEFAARLGRHRSPLVLDQAFPGAYRATQAQWGRAYALTDDDAPRFWAAVIDRTFAERMPAELHAGLYQAFAEPGRWRIQPGAKEAVALAMDHRLPVAVVSNFDGRLPPLLTALGLGPFAAVIHSTAVGAAKPDPVLLREACRHLAVPINGTLHVGDSAIEDGAMAAAAGASWLAVEPLRGIDLGVLRGLLEAR